MYQLLDQIRQCTICEDYLPNKPNPILSAHKASKIAIIGQAPGRIVDETGKPWYDKSGERLRSWLGVETTEALQNLLLQSVPCVLRYWIF